MTAGARARILECLAATPGLTAGQVGHALGLRSNAMRQLKDMLYAGEVIAVPQWRAQMGREVSTWHVAPPGTVPPPRPEPDPAAAARKRERDTAARRDLRAKASGKPAPFSSLRPGPVPVPDLSAAACRDADPELFFAPEMEPVSAEKRREAAAKTVCGSCPVRLRCLRFALHSRQAYGIWGGTTEAERRAMLREAARRAS